MFFLLLFGCTLASTNYTKPTDSFSWGPITVYNKAWSGFNDPPTIPYQVIEDVAPNQMRGYFNQPSGIVQFYDIQSYQSMESKAMQNIRADSGQVNGMELNFTMSGSPPWYDALFFVNVLRYDAATLTTSTIMILIYAAINTGSSRCGGSWTAVNVAGVTYKRQNYCFEQLTSPSSSSSGTIFFNDFLQVLVNAGLLNQYDLQTTHRVAVFFSGVENYSLSIKDVSPSSIQSTTSGEISLGNYTYDSLQYNPNRFSADYLNVTYVNGASSISGPTVDFLYTRNAMNAYPRTYMGYLNGKWYTANTGSDFPISAIDPTVSLKANFVYTESDTIASGKAACIGLALRNDYNPSTQAYDNQQTYPAMEVQVCTWWSPGLTRNGSLGLVKTRESNYELCVQTDGSADNSTRWPAYLFIRDTNVLSVSDLDLWSFIDYIHDHVYNLTGYYVTGAYFGFRIYTGKGKFVYTQHPQIVRSTAISLPSESLLSLLSATISDTISAPSVIILLQLSPIVIVLDDMSYYSYHTVKYDRGFRLLVDYCWDLNNNKWIPPVLNDTYQKMNALLNGLQINDWANRTPSRFLAKEQTVYFLNNAQDFLFSSLPLTLISFVLLRLLRRKVKCQSVLMLLQPFSSFSYLFLALLGDNIQYLSFRSFQQLRFIVPKSKLQLVSIVLSIITLNVVLICAASLYPLILKFDQRFQLENMRTLRGSLTPMTVTLFCRAAAGFVHAYIDNEYLQTAALFATSMATLVVICSFHNEYSVKRNYFCLVFIMIYKTVLNAILVVELFLSFESYLFDTIQQAFSDLSTLFLQLTAILLIVQYLITAVPGFLNGFFQLFQSKQQPKAQPKKGKEMSGEKKKSKYSKGKESKQGKYKEIKQIKGKENKQNKGREIRVIQISEQDAQLNRFRRFKIARQKRLDRLKMDMRL